MKVNTKIRYGLRAMMELSCPDNKMGILQKDIAKNQQLSEKYLDPIISALKTKGLIVNVAGKKSGYMLSKPASKITLFEIFNSFENGPEIVPCIRRAANCDRSKHCAAKECWTELNTIISDYMKKTTLETLCKRNSELCPGKNKSKKVSVKK